MKKKILSMLLAVLMLTSILPMSAISAYAAVITEETVVTNLNVGDIVVRGTNIKVATHTYKKKVGNRTQTVVVPLLTVNGENYGTIIRYVNNDSCVKITSQESTVNETNGVKDYKDIITVENACNYVPYNKISDATVDAPAQYESKCTYCNAVATGPVGDKLPAMQVSYNDPVTGDKIEFIEPTTNDGVEDVVKKLMVTPFQIENQIFTGWYTGDKALKEGTTRFDQFTNISARFFKIVPMAKDTRDEKNVKDYMTFELAGVQIREENTKEVDKEEVYGGLRFVASLSDDIMSNLDIIQYGFAVATRENAEANANGDENYVIKNKDKNVRLVNCKGMTDHRTFKDNYRLYTMVIDYEGNEELKGEEIVVRPYIAYRDANGVARIFYGSYRGTNTYGGLSTSYNNAVAL